MHLNMKMKYFSNSMNKNVIIIYLKSSDYLILLVRINFWFLFGLALLEVNCED